MLFDKISMDLDLVIANLKKFEAPDRMPAENALLQTEGSSYGAAHNFNFEIEQTARTLEKVAKRVRENLENTRDAVKATMEDMVETDASLAAVASTPGRFAHAETRSSTVGPTGSRVSPDVAWQILV